MNILVADDHNLVADLISDHLSGEQYQVYSVYDHRKVLNSIEENDIDVLLLDLFFPDQEGIGVLKEVKDKYKKLPVIILSSNFSPNLINKAFDNGALGYLTKNISKDELLSTIDKVNSGEKHICDPAKDTILKSVMNLDNDKIPLSEKLTKREYEILKLLFKEELTSKQIAEKLNISDKTVEKHRANLLEKFEAKSTLQLLKIALENNII